MPLDACRALVCDGLGPGWSGGDEEFLDKGSRVAVEGRLHVDFVAVRGATESEVRRSRLAVEVIVDRISYRSPVKRLSDASAEDTVESKPTEGRRSGR